MAVVIITSIVSFIASLWEGHFTWVNSSLTERKNSSGRDIELFYHERIVIGACITVEDVLTVIGDELWRELPKDSHGQVLILHIEGCYVEDAGVVEVGNEDFPLKVRIDPVSTNFPEGSVCIGYGQGNLESFQIPPAGCLDL